MDDILTKLPQALPGWYEENKRDLPWRRTRDPYRIWVSEIMLQQTRVEAVKGYYARFLQALPTVQALARCDDDALHKLWEGLGYYSRVRNLKKCAQVLCERYGGVFPRDHQAVLALPGIGPYTAGAICSIAFDLPTPAVDGNVLRLLSRLRDDGRPIDAPVLRQEVTAGLREVYPGEAGTFTQALMELGATLCGPNREPQCGGCPCARFCLGHLRGTAAALPVKSPKKPKRLEEKTVFILRCGNRYALRKRKSSGLLAGLWEFPNMEGIQEPQQALDALAAFDLTPRQLEKTVRRKHIFTHIIWDMQGIYAEVEGENAAFQWMTAEEVNKAAALPTAFKLFWEESHV